MRVSQWWVSVTVLAFLLAPGSVTGSDRAAAVPGDEATFDRRIEAAMAQAGLVGVGAAIIIDKQLVWSKGYGSPTSNAGCASRPTR